MRGVKLDEEVGARTMKEQEDHTMILKEPNPSHR
jgi:hypothetical protein